LRVDKHCCAKNNEKKQPKKKQCVPKAQYTNMWKPRLEKDECNNRFHKTITSREMSHQTITSREMRRQSYGNKREAISELNGTKQQLKRKRNDAMQRDNGMERDEPKERASFTQNTQEQLVTNGRDNNSAALVTEAERTV